MPDDIVNSVSTPEKTTEVPVTPVVYTDQDFLKAYDEICVKFNRVFSYKLALAKNEDQTFNPDKLIVDVFVSPK